jgi:1,4-dihydroxy-2-naphthoyl-CoA synthase
MSATEIPGGHQVQLETMYSQADGPVATLVLNRPQVLNCANEQWARDLNTLVDELTADARIRVVVRRGPRLLQWNRFDGAVRGRDYDGVFPELGD